MSIKCLIAKLNDDSTVSNIICRQTGSVEEVSHMLLNYYNTEDKVNELHTLNYLELFLPLFVIIDIHKSFFNEDDMLKSINKDIEYIYLFKNGKWYLNNIELTELL